MMSGANPSKREHGISLRIDYSKIDVFDGSNMKTLMRLSDNPAYFNIDWRTIEHRWSEAIQGIGTVDLLTVYYEHPFFTLLPNNQINSSENYLNLLAQDIDAAHLTTTVVDDLMSIQYILPGTIRGMVNHIQPKTASWKFLPTTLIQHCKTLILDHIRVCMLYASAYCYICVVSPRGILFLNSFYANDVEDVLYYVLTIKRMFL